MRGESKEELAETGRLEAFSDGVFAVAITVLALDLAVPHLANGDLVANLWTALLRQWPTYLAYVLSFFTILVMWINHHAMFLIIGKANRALMLLNGTLLLLICAVPFGTALLADYLQHPEAHVAQGVYCGLYVLLALNFNIMLRYATHNRRLLKPSASAQAVSAFRRQYAFGPAFYGIALIADWFSVGLSLALCILLAVFFALPHGIAGAWIPGRSWNDDGPDSRV